MVKNQNIQLLTANNIDRIKWDECIDQCSHGLIYATSVYLDNLHAEWCGLVGENYEWVLPITCKKKWTISYLFQPPFTQQLGVFQKPGVVIPFQHIVTRLQEHYKFWELSWNYATPVFELERKIEAKKATNFVLDLQQGYKSISTGYHKDLVKNLKRSKKNSLTYLCTSDFIKCVNLYQKHYGERLPHVKDDDYNNFKSVCNYLSENNGLICRQAVNDDGELLSVALLLKHKRRLYNLMNTTTDAGKKMEANHFLIDAILREFAGEDLLFDFEGSDLPGVKSFYENFGAQDQPYFQLRYNNLPWPIKLAKN